MLFQILELICDKGSNWLSIKQIELEIFNINDDGCVKDYSSQDNESPSYKKLAQLSSLIAHNDKNWVI